MADDEDDDEDADDDDDNDDDEEEEKEEEEEEEDDDDDDEAGAGIPEPGISAGSGFEGALALSWRGGGFAGGTLVSSLVSFFFCFVIAASLWCS